MLTDRSRHSEWAENFAAFVGACFNFFHPQRDAGLIIMAKLRFIRETRWATKPVAEYKLAIIRAP